MYGTNDCGQRLCASCANIAESDGLCHGHAYRAAELRLMATQRRAESQQEIFACLYASRR